MAKHSKLLLIPKNSLLANGEISTIFTEPTHCL